MNGIDIYAFWQRVKIVREQLPAGDEFALMSEASEMPGGAKAGFLFWMDRERTAQALVKKSHRLATEAEIEAWRKEDAAKGESIQSEEIRRMQKVQYVMPPEMIAALTGKRGKE